MSVSGVAESEAVELALCRSLVDSGTERGMRPRRRWSWGSRSSQRTWSWFGQRTRRGCLTLLLLIVSRKRYCRMPSWPFICYLSHLYSKNFSLSLRSIESFHLISRNELRTLEVGLFHTWSLYKVLFKFSRNRKASYLQYLGQMNDFIALHVSKYAQV